MFDTRSGFWLMASIVISACSPTAAIIVFAPDDELTYDIVRAGHRRPDDGHPSDDRPAVGHQRMEPAQRPDHLHPDPAPRASDHGEGLASISVGVASMVLAFAIGALGTLVGTAITGTTAVWDVSLADSSYIVLGNLLGLMIGFMLGVLIRNSPGAIVAYFVYTFALTPLFILLANSQAWFHDSRAWIDVNFAQAPLFMFDGAVTGEQWANIGFTAVFWLVIPLAVGLRQVLRTEVA